MRGCLVVHGLTGTPATVARVSTALTKQGFHVVAPCLAGHSGTLETLSKTTWQEWYETVSTAFHELRHQATSIYYAGISLGALLGLQLAIDEGDGLHAMALMSTPLKLSPWNRIAIPLVRYTPLRSLITSIPKKAEESVADPEGQKLYLQHSLSRIPVHAAIEITKLQRHLKPKLHGITTPTLLVHAKKDLVAPYSNVRLLKRLIGAHIVEIATFTRSRHVITLDLEKDLAANAIVQFFKRFP